MRIFQTRSFARFAKKADIDSTQLRAVVDEMSAGVIHADLGSGLYKQRVGRQGKGKSGGFRTLLVFRSGDRAVFVFGFAKNERANIDMIDLKELRFLAKRILAFTVKELEMAVKRGDFVEVKRGS